MNRMRGVVVALVALGGMGLHGASAEGMRLPRIEHAVTLKECGACHMVYSPQMLPQRSWQAIMSSLESHFGENANLDEAMKQDVLSYLLANAADAPGQKGYLGLLRGVTSDAVPNRITEMPWFGGSHGEASFGKRKASNCIACHVGADKSMVYAEPD